jgi:glycosyltransferase involved in cell wall biosynthesis
MKFSISTTFYKRDFAVEEIYKQVLDQTHNDWEWIVTDDFSEEHSAEALLLDICSQDSRVKYFPQTRKKEMYWNPQKGCSGEFVLQLDSDDYLYPRTLEIYNHLFLKHPEVAGISCLSHTVDADGEWIEIQGGGLYDSGEHNKFPYVPMGKAFRNIFPEFDNGTLKWYQQDTNIVRHIETIGKWLYLPRVQYKYFYSDTTISRAPGRTQEDFISIEKERLFIESKFPYLDNPDQTTAFLYYHPIQDTARDFALADFNIGKQRKKILYVKEDIKVYEKQLLKELFFDQDLYFDINQNIKFDEIIIRINPKTFAVLDFIIDKLRETNIHTSVKLRLDTRDNIDAYEFLTNKFPGGYGWCQSGCETYFITAL